MSVALIDSREHQIEALFQAALQRPERERTAYLVGACGDDVDIAREVQALLDAMQAGADALAGDAPALPEGGFSGVVRSLGAEGPAPETIGPFRVLRTLGQGGFGVVYLAEQDEPVRRCVAVKLVKRGMDTEQVVARFGRERQALALLDHPCIAKVLDAGAADDGRPYFAMEYVPGLPITEYCDRHQLDTEARLRLFIDVCEAVQHAHQKGVLHRDLKPSNILVQARGDRPEPKVIDFGLAKALGQRLDDESLLTYPGAFVGTFEYASPEQAKSDGLDADSRSDIYSLGVLCYELLTGQLPFGALGENGLFEVQRILCEVEPPRPSTRVTNAGRGSDERVRARRTDVGTLQRRLRGDLDWIVMKALEKDRTRRYASASELAADVRRHLNHEPVLAGPPDATYRLVKFARRNRRAVVSGGLMLLLLILGSVGTTFGWLHARREGQRAAAAEQVARREADVSQAVGEFLADMLRSANPRGPGATAGIARELSVVEVLRRSAVEIDGTFDASPAVEAKLRLTIGQSLAGLGLAEEAHAQLARGWRLLEQELGPEDPRTLRAQSELAAALGGRGELEAAFGRLAPALERQRALLGDRHRDTLASRTVLAQLLHRRGEWDAAETNYRETLAAQEELLGLADADTLATARGLGMILGERGRMTESGELMGAIYRAARGAFGAQHPDTLDAQRAFGTALRYAGDYEGARPLLLQAFEDGRRVLGAEHPSAMDASVDWALFLEEVGELAKAESVLREVRERAAVVLGEENSRTLWIDSVLGQVLFQGGDYAGAEAVLRGCLERARVLYGPAGSVTLTLSHDLATLLSNTGPLEEALELATHAYRHRAERLGAEHRLTFESANQMALLLESFSRADEAIVLLEGALDAARVVLGVTHPDTVNYLGNLAFLLDRRGRTSEAERLVRELWGALEALDADSLQLMDVQNWLALFLSNRGRDGEAIELGREVYERRRSVLGPEHPSVLSDLGNLAMYYRRGRQFDAAEPLFLECLEALERVQGPDAPQTLLNRHNYGVLLLEAGRRAEGEELFRDLFERRFERFGPREEGTLLAAETLLGLYRSSGRDAQAEALAERLAAN